MQRFNRVSECSKCSLDGQRRVRSELPDGPSNGILLLGEAPGAAEEAEGVPFTGPSGRLLNWALKCSGIDRHRSWVANVIEHRPPANDIGGFEARSALRACSGGLAAELKAARQAGVRVIVALGDTALKALGELGGPSALRGSVLDGTGIAEGFYVIPTFHPAFLYRNNHTRMMGGSAGPLGIWLSDLEKAREVARPGWRRPAEHFTLFPTVRDLELLRERVRDEPDLVLGTDIETTGLDPKFAEPVVVGFATSAEDAIVVPLLKAGPVGHDGRRHGIPYWSNQDAGKARRLLGEILSTAKQSYQNCFFDVPFLRAHGFSIPDNLIVYDSLLLHSIVSPETPHDLGFITSVYGQTPYWKDEFKKRVGSIFDMDEALMRQYNARDCVVLHQIIPAMLRHMDELNLLPEWEEEVKPMIRPLMLMQHHGVLFNFAKMGPFKEKLNKILSEKQKELREIAKLPEEFSLASTADLGLFLFGKVPAKAAELTSWVFTCKVPAKPTKALPERTSKEEEKIAWGFSEEKEARRSLDPSWEVLSARKARTLDLKRRGTDAYEALVQLETLLAETKPLYLVPNYSGPRTDGGSFSTDKDGLLSLRVAAQNRLEYLEALKTPKEEENERVLSFLDWLSLFADYKEYYKLYTSFTNYRTGQDGRIHPRYRFVSTGRLGCADPNLMQLPKPKDKSEKYDDAREIRRFFISAPGCSMVSADFESAECGLLFFEINDAELIALYESGANIHDNNTRVLFGFDKDHPLWKLGRAAAKVFQFGGLNYGGGDRFVHREIVKSAPQLNLTFAGYQKVKQNWLDAHPNYGIWYNEVKEEVLTKRTLYNAFGRVRIFLDNDKDIVKEGLNFKIQSANASLLNRVISRIQKRIDESSPKLHGYPIMQVHDQLVYECPDDEVPIFARLLKEEMTRPFMYKGVERALHIELETGKNFGDLVEYKDPA